MLHKFDCGCQFPILQENPLLLDFRVKKIPPDCPAVWNLLATGRTKGIFQLESQLGRRYCKILKPENIEHLAALGSILRPGVLQNRDENGVSLTDHYCKRKNNQEETPIYHESLKDILDTTYQIIVYQEQAILIAQKLAGFNPVEADLLRIAAAKKQPEEMAKVEKMFAEGAIKTGLVNEEQAKEIFSWIKKSQRYSFNKCIVGTESIRRLNRNNKFGTKLNIEQMYNIKNNIEYAKSTGHLSLYKKWKLIQSYGNGLSQNLDNRIRPNIIKNISYSGKQPTFKITLANYKNISVTLNHKFPTSIGILDVNEIINKYKLEQIDLFYCGEYEKENGKKYGFSNISQKEIKNRESSNKAVNKCYGDKNWAYTNGAFTEWKKNNKIIPKICNRCHKTKGRLELDHKDGNRANNSLENLERLCPSCHKKKEYQNGRVKIGEKGYPTFSSKIVNIEYLGIQDVYDVEMNGPHHNFVTEQDIITCNSHATAYGITGYDTAYLKAHFPPAFFLGWLMYAKDKEETEELIEDARFFHIDIRPPDLRDKQTNFYIKDNQIRFGLSNIKGLGEANIERVLQKEIKGNNWYEFLLQTLINFPISVATSLIKAGALDYFGLSRNRMSAESKALFDMTENELIWVQANWSKYSNLIDLFKAAGKISKEGGATHGIKRANIIQSHAMLLENPPSPLTDSPEWIIKIEKDLLGASLTCSTLDTCNTIQADTTCREFANGLQEKVKIAGEIKRISVMKSKRGRSAGEEMAFLSISDSTGMISDVMMFPEAYKKYSNLIIEGNTILVTGERDKKTRMSLIVKKLQQL